MIETLMGDHSGLDKKLKRWARRIQYKPNWRIYATHEYKYIKIHIEFDTPCADRPQTMTTIAGDYMELDSTLLAQDFNLFQAYIHSKIRHLEMHELDEWFRVDGERTREPHGG